MPFVTMMEEADGEDAKLVYCGLLDEIPGLGDLVVMPSAWPEKWVVISRTVILKDDGIQPASWLLIVGQSEC